ncbi:MAG TPA: beta-ketoacyl synthase N-terminal-like domain-containing protein, partial [Solirubrobacterales bacterium]
MTKSAKNGSQVAVVGISCRFPAAPDPGAFWRLLANGQDAIEGTPAERWEMAGRSFEEGLSEADPGTRFGGFLDRVDRFEPAFFDISPREAAAMDPQQRLVLELSWEALEDAGIAASAIRGHAAGVFLGAIAGDYAEVVRRAGVDAVGRHTVTGLHRSIIANRVSYTLGFTGPSLTVDAAQSASLVAVHLACESLHSGESEIALAGGVHLNIDPGEALGASKFGGLSPDGRCHAFDERANGYVRGEGGGLVVLKPLAAARADGDRVYCVIRGSAVNNDGGGAGLTVPSRTAQERVIRRACKRAGLKRSEVQYVELHGSGTAVGDPIEAAALGAVLGSSRRGKEPLSVGSVKTNIGHLEGAAGIAGLIKTALAIERRKIPASLNFESPNPEIPIDELGLQVQGALEDWPRDEQPLIAGVSSFGMGGTNCHLVVSEEPLLNQKNTSKKKDPDERVGSAREAAERHRLPAQLPFALSAKSPEALRESAALLAGRLQESPDLDQLDVAYSLVSTRSDFEHRAVALAEGREELLDALGALAAGEPSASVVKATAKVGRLAWLFTGQGSQRAGMGRELCEVHPIYATALDRVCAELDQHLDRPLGPLLFAEPGSSAAKLLNHTSYAQPALFATEVALFRLLESWGLSPDLLAGHSIGELVAAHVAGVLALPDAARLVAARATLMGELAAGGAMLAIQATEQEAEESIEGMELSVAAVNGPTSVVVSGGEGAIVRAQELWQARGRKTKRLRVSHAFHSALMEPMLEPFSKVAESLAYSDPKIPIVSNRSGAILEPSEATDPAYWVAHVRERVRFADGVATLAGEGAAVYLELGPDAVLSAMAAECLLAVDRPAAMIATLRDGRPEVEALSAALGGAHANGAGVDWSACFQGTGAKRVSLPTYPFQRERFWIDASTSVERGESGVDGERRPSPPPAEPDRAVSTSTADDVVALPGAEREEHLLDLVRAEVAAVLGHASAQEVRPDKAFKELGFDSLAAVELRSRLRESTGVRLPAAAIFNYPTAALLAGFLFRQATGAPAEGDLVVESQSSDEPIAIVGIGCRYPGAIESADELWELVAAGRDAIGAFPDDRGWDLERLYHPDADRAGTTYAREGGFLYDAGEFDAGFFGISPREALAMDPQQRLLLEGAWEALEDAGIDPASLRG